MDEKKQNWVKVNRQMLDSNVFQDSKTLHVFMWLLLNANYKKRTLLNGLTLLPGQLCTSRARIAVGCNLHESSVHRVLKRLQRCASIDQKANSTGTVIGIINWGLFQHQEPGGEQQTNSKRTATEQRPNIEEEGKKVRREELVLSAQPDGLHTVRSNYTQDFLVFWDAWPPRRKTNKKRAFDAFKKAKKRVPVKDLMEAVHAFAKSNKGRGEFSPMPSTWLNGDCWEDDRAGWNEGTAPPPLRKEKTPEQLHAMVRVRDLTDQLNELRAQGLGMTDEAEAIKQDMRKYE